MRYFVTWQGYLLICVIGVYEVLKNVSHTRNYGCEEQGSPWGKTRPTTDFPRANHDSDGEPLCDQVQASLQSLNLEFCYGTETDDLITMKKCSV